MAHFIVQFCAFEHHRQAVKPFHLLFCQDLAVPLKYFLGFFADSVRIKIRMKCEEIVVAADGGDFVLHEKINAFTGGTAVSDDVAST